MNNDRVLFLCNRSEWMTLDRVDLNSYKAFRDWEIIIDSGSKSISNYARDYDCAYIGNTPYKRICEIYKIKHNERA